MPIDRIVIDSSAARTELCTLGRLTGTDKSPYNTVAHRHPYTAVYNMLFAPLKAKPIRFAEIGVAMGRSAFMWDMFFTNPETELIMFDRDEVLLAYTKERVGSRVKTALMDVGVDGNVDASLRSMADGLYDVIIDDSSHDFEHQIRIINEAIPLIKPGGLLIIEDVFRDRAEKDYENALPLLSKVTAVYFVVCDHELRYSPGWNNDKMLVIVV